MESNGNYYFVGAVFGSDDQTERFIREGKWELGWFNEEDNSQYQKMLGMYNQIQPGDVLVIKSTYTRKNDLPFSNPSNTAVSTMKLKAIGTVKQNLKDGHTLLVDWDKNFEAKEWYFFTGRETIWQVSSSTYDSAQKLIDFAVGNKSQDYEWFLEQPEWRKYKVGASNTISNSDSNDLTDEDYEAFKEYLDGFLEIVNESKGNQVGKLPNYIPKGKGRKNVVKLSSGLPLARHFARGSNTLLRFPYINNQNWTNLYLDWKPEYFSEPTLFVTIPNRESSEFKYQLDSSLNVTSRKNPNDVNGYQAKSGLNDISYHDLLDAMNELSGRKETKMVVNERVDKLATNLQNSKNIILHGAPGTGKTYLAKEIAASIITHGRTSKLSELTKGEKEQYGFVQFHPSYDYTDFVEGLRPKKNEEGFELQPGVFSKFITKALNNYKDSQKSKQNLEKEQSAKALIDSYFADMEFPSETLKTKNGTEFKIISVEDNSIKIFIPENEVANSLSLNIAELTAMLESRDTFDQVKDITQFFGKKHATQNYSYDLAIFNEIRQVTGAFQTSSDFKEVEMKPFIFVIDEINRGEISKIFGELFYSIDPGYRGDEDGVFTQYSNLHSDPEEKFYIPKNVYIIGTMNDIDRSVDTFDFAMRRRFTFIEITAEESAKAMLTDSEVIAQMEKLNKAIVEKGGLTPDYQIGASYFRELDAAEVNSEDAPLWETKIYPLLKDYFRGEHKSQEKLQNIKKEYFDEED